MSPKRAIARLRDELLDLQFALRETKRGAVALIVTGSPAAGRSETINALLEWLDPKFIRVHAFGRPNEIERARPPMWRYWQTLPARGRMAFYFAGWYADSLTDARKLNRARPANAKRALARIRQLETMLRKDGIEVAKVHLHIDHKTQLARLKRLRADELTRWRITEEDRWFAKHYHQTRRIMGRYLKATSHAAAPWHSVDGRDEQARVLEVGRILRNAMKSALVRTSSPSRSARRKERSRAAACVEPEVRATAIDKARYDHELEALQGRLALLVRSPSFCRHALVLAFEGMDAAGKGGAIRRITHALDARQYHVTPVSAPSPTEALYPYLWRFWPHVPAHGDIAIYDRSWYGRVLVERVRDFTPVPDWRRAYDEINEFERQLAEHGTIVVKFWLIVGKEEQLKRFEARENNPLKRFKVDTEDWANHRHFDAYQAAAREMIRRTSKAHAPWITIDSNEKKHARLEVLRRVCEEIDSRVGG